MSTLTLRATGRAPTALVWRRYADTRLWPTWSPQIRSVALDSDTTVLRAGLTGRVVGPGGVRVRFEVESIDETTLTWVWRVHLGPVTMRMQHAVVSAPTGSATTLSIEGPALVAAAYWPLARLALQRLVHPCADTPLGPSLDTPPGPSLDTPPGPSPTPTAEPT